MLSNNTSFILLPSAPEGNLSFQDSGFIPSSKKVVDVNYGDSVCLLCLTEAEWLIKWLFSYVELKARKVVLPPDNPCSPHQSQGRKKNTSPGCASLCWCSADLRGPWQSLTPCPGPWVRRNSWDRTSKPLGGEQPCGGSRPGPPQHRGIRRKSSISTQTFLAPLKLEARQDSSSASRLAGHQTQNNCWHDELCLCQTQGTDAPTSLTRSTLTSPLTAESSSISILQAEDQPGTKYPTSNWSYNCSQ